MKRQLIVTVLGAAMLTSALAQAKNLNFRETRQAALSRVRFKSNWQQWKLLATSDFANAGGRLKHFYAHPRGYLKTSKRIAVLDHYVVAVDRKTGEAKAFPYQTAVYRSKYLPGPPWTTKIAGPGQAGIVPRLPVDLRTVPRK